MSSTNRASADPRVRLEEVLGFSDLVGQEEVIARLRAFGDLYAAKDRAPEHVLITGAEGMGKRTIARAFARAYNSAVQNLPLELIDGNQLKNLLAEYTQADR